MAEKNGSRLDRQVVRLQPCRPYQRQTLTALGLLRSSMSIGGSSKVTGLRAQAAAPTCRTNCWSPPTKHNKGAPEQALQKSAIQPSENLYYGSSVLGRPGNSLYRCDCTEICIQSLWLTIRLAPGIKQVSAMIGSAPSPGEWQTRTIEMLCICGDAARPAAVDGGTTESVAKLVRSKAIVPR